MHVIPSGPVSPGCQPAVPETLPAPPAGEVSSRVYGVLADPGTGAGTLLPAVRRACPGREIALYRDPRRSAISIAVPRAPPGPGPETTRSPVRQDIAFPVRPQGRAGEAVLPVIPEDPEEEAQVYRESGTRARRLDLLYIAFAGPLTQAERLRLFRGLGREPSVQFVMVECPEG